MLYWIFYAIIILASVLPLSIAASYFFIGLNLARIGIKENNSGKISAGKQTMMYASLGFILIIVATVAAFKFL